MNVDQTVQIGSHRVHDKKQYEAHGVLSAHHESDNEPDNETEPLELVSLRPSDEHKH